MVSAFAGEGGGVGQGGRGGPGGGLGLGGMLAFNSGEFDACARVDVDARWSVFSLLACSELACSTSHTARCP